MSVTCPHVHCARVYVSRDPAREDTFHNTAAPSQEHRIVSRNTQRRTYKLEIRTQAKSAHSSQLRRDDLKS